MVVSVRIVHIKKLQGMTLLEVMLVLLIGASITVMGIRVYQSWVLQSNIEQVKSSVDTLLSSVANYYQAVCGQTSSPVLSPTSINPVVINISTTLMGLPGGSGSGPVTVSPKYLISSIIPNPLLDTTAATGSLQGYYAQLNPISGAMQTYACWNFGTSTYGTSVKYDTGPYNTSNVVCSNKPQPSTPTYAPLPSPAAVIVWKAQVAVKLRSDLNAATYQQLMAADCTSSLSGTGGVAPCKDNTPGQYLVWERLPSLASPDTSSGYWISMPGIKLFKRQYEHDQMLELTGSTGTGSQYYLCGG